MLMPCSSASPCSSAWRAATSATMSLTACDVAGRAAGAVRARDNCSGSGEPCRPELKPACNRSAPERLAGAKASCDGAALSGCSRVLDSAGLSTGRRTLATGSAIPPNSSAIPAQSPPLAPPRRRPIRSGTGMLSSTTTMQPGRLAAKVGLHATTQSLNCEGGMSGQFSSILQNEVPRHGTPPPLPRPRG